MFLRIAKDGVSPLMAKIKEQVVPFHRVAVGEEEAQAAADVVRSGWLTMGARTIEFEKTVCRVCRRQACGWR